MTGVSRWLPTTCLTSPQLAKPFAHGVAQWCAHWFADGLWKAADTWVPETPTATADRHRTLGFEIGGLTCWIRTEGRANLVERLLDCDLTKPSLSKGDHALFEMLKDKALEDLRSRLEAIGIPHKAAENSLIAYEQKPEPRYVLKVVNAAQQTMMALTAARSTLVETALALAPPSHIQTKLCPLSEVIGEIEVHLGVCLGQVSLPLMEITNLGVGDVIALNAGVHEELSITIDGVQTAQSIVTLQPNFPNINLHMTRSLN